MLRNAIVIVVGVESSFKPLLSIVIVNNTLPFHGASFHISLGSTVFHFVRKLQFTLKRAIVSISHYIYRESISIVASIEIEMNFNYCAQLRRHVVIRQATNHSMCFHESCLLAQR